MPVKGPGVSLRIHCKCAMLLRLGAPTHSVSYGRSKATVTPNFVCPKCFVVGSIKNGRVRYDEKVCVTIVEGIVVSDARVPVPDVRPAEAIIVRERFHTDPPSQVLAAMGI